MQKTHQNNLNQIKHKTAQLTTQHNNQQDQKLGKL